MVMGSTSISNRSASEKEERVTSTKKKGSKLHENGDSSSPAKRSNKPPEIRVVGGRIYDSVNGKCCHQCRQKTMDFVAACKNLKNNKQCTIMYCYKCLLNRYGEKAEEVAALKVWSCPKCRGICNCSICMKRRGQQPTGLLTNTAKSAGFSSVSEMLLMGATHLSNAEVVVSSLGKRGKENSFDGNIDANLPNHIDKKSKKVREIQKGDWRVNIHFPLGIELNSVAGIDIQTEDVGNALQFLEFCAVFGKILDVKKGQPEHVLQDLLHGRARRGKFSLAVQFHINLLSIVLSDREKTCVKLNPSDGNDSWFNMLKKFLSESESVLKALGLDSFNKASDYATLKASEKLKLLNILCDEVLETEKLRNWMEDQRKRHAEKVREAKRKVTAANDKDKNLKQKMKDDIAHTIIAKHGAPLSISEQEAIVYDIKQKTAQAHAKVLESNGMLLENGKLDVLRIEPFFSGVGGHVYWKLNCMGKSNVVHQDAGQEKGDSLTLDDKWFVLDDEGKEAIEKYISLSKYAQHSSFSPDYAICN